MSYDNFTHGGCKVNPPDPKPMTHDEIHTLINDYREDLFQPAPSPRIAVLLTAIETLLAENAKLDAIRAVLKSPEWRYAEHTDHDGQLARIVDILYPTNPGDTP